MCHETSLSAIVTGLCAVSETSLSSRLSGTVRNLWVVSDTSQSNQLKSVKIARLKRGVDENGPLSRFKFKS